VPTGYDVRNTVIENITIFEQTEICDLFPRKSVPTYCHIVRGFGIMTYRKRVRTLERPRSSKLDYYVSAGRPDFERITRAETYAETRARDQIFEVNPVEKWSKQTGFHDGKTLRNHSRAVS